MKKVSSNKVSQGDGLSRDERRNLIGRFQVLTQQEAAASDLFVTCNQLFELWRSLPGNPPHFRHFKPGTIAPALIPNCIMMDVIDGGQDYRWRIYGTSHVTHFGADLTGWTVSDVEKANPASKVIREVYDMIMANHAPVFFVLDYSNRNKVVKRASGAMLPLADDAGEIARIVGIMDWFSADA